MTTAASLSTRVARNAALNVAGQALQLLAALAAVPLLVRGLGPQAFGAFQLIWIILGYLALVDVGLGRATTRFVAEALGRGAAREIPDIVWSATALQLILGGIGAMVLLLLSTPLARRLLEIPTPLIPDVVTGLRLMALALPAILLSASFSGVLEAHQRFALVNAVRVPSGVATMLAPLAALAFGARLVGIVGAVVLVRYLALVAWVLACRAAVPALRAGGRPSRERLRTLLGFGGWVTVSNVISPLMVYLDRFVIGARLGLEAVAHYTAPFDAITRAAILPSGLAQALFPAFSSLHASADRGRASRIGSSAVRVLVTVMGPLTAAVILGAPEVLHLWLGTAFAAAGTLPLQIMALGVLTNALAQVPYALLQGAGRADLTARFHLLELPLYGGALWLLTSRYGIVGAAIAWSARCTLDALLLFAASGQVLEIRLPLFRPLLLGALLPALLATSLAATGLDGLPALGAAAAIGCLGVLVGWVLVLGTEERMAALRLTSGPTKFPSA